MSDTFTETERSCIMAAVKSKDTAPEMIVRRLTHAMGYRYRLHHPGLPGKPDMVFPARRKIIIVNGCFWHMHNCGRCRIPASRQEYWTAKLHKNAARDKLVKNHLRKAGWETLTIWECQTRPSHLTRLRKRISAFLH